MPVLPWAMNAILYNCCSAVKAARLQQILTVLDVDILMLTGMRWRADRNSKTPYQTMRVGRYFCYIWGYGQGALTNKAAGVGIFLSRRLREKHVKEIHSPESWLQGRAGMVRCKFPGLDIDAMVRYPPPDSGQRQKAQAAAETMKWIRLKVCAAAQRTVPIVGCDNVGISAQVDGVLGGTGSCNVSPQGTGGG